MVYLPGPIVSSRNVVTCLPEVVKIAIVTFSLLTSEKVIVQPCVEFFTAEIEVCVVECDNETWTEYYSKLRENIVKAQRFALSEEVESSVVESFTT